MRWFSVLVVESSFFVGPVAVWLFRFLISSSDLEFCYWQCEACGCIRVGGDFSRSFVVECWSLYFRELQYLFLWWRECG